MMASTVDAKVYGNTYDIPSHKWVMEMTQKELEDRGYVKKEEPTEETSLEGQTSPAVAKVSSRKKSTVTSTTK